MPKEVIRIIVRLQIEGVHKWQQCPIEEVSYLKDLHRHIFHIKCTRRVSHADRDIEIIQFKHQINQHLVNKYFDKAMQLINFNNNSCESIALELINKFNLDSCEVTEDGENGAIIIVEY